jgi:hypothetical protein
MRRTGAVALATALLLALPAAAQQEKSKEGKTLLE